MTETRRCVGSTRFGIESHDAPISEFSVQKSQKDGLCRMCSLHWKQYVGGLAREAKERKAASDAPPELLASPKPSGQRRRKRPTSEPGEPVAQESVAE